METKSISRSGFTLIEMSIVLVVIGLIVGGILTGKDLIDAAAQRAQVTQIERYNTAVRAFQTKYNSLPGDIPNPYATQFGFLSRGQYAGEGDGNGIIEGIDANGSAQNDGAASFSGEAAMFWVDLSTAKMIDGGFSTGTPTAVPGAQTVANISLYFPAAKIGNGNFVYVWSGGWGCQSPAYGGTNPGNGINYYGVSAVNGSAAAAPQPISTPTFTVAQAYNIDKKIDDGMPQSGGVTAMYVDNPVPWNTSIAWAAGGGNWGANNGGTTYGPTTAATPYATTNCYDNANAGGTGVAGVQQTYSLKNANQQNCALSFKFQ